MIGQEPEKRDIETASSSFRVFDDRWQLKVVANEDEGICEAKRTDTGGKSDLRSFVDDAVVESAAGEDWTAKQARVRSERIVRLRIPQLTDLSIDTSSRRSADS